MIVGREIGAAGFSAIPGQPPAACNCVELETGRMSDADQCAQMCQEAAAVAVRRNGVSVEFGCSRRTGITCGIGPAACRGRWWS